MANKKERERIVEEKIENVIYLKYYLSLIMPLTSLLSSSNNPCFDKYLSMIDDERFSILAKKIDQVIQPECQVIKGAINFKKMKCNAIKSKQFDPLGFARVKYSDAIEEIENHLNDMIEKCKIPMKTSYTIAKGFVIQVLSKDLNNLQKFFSNEIFKTPTKTASKNYTSFTTRQLNDINIKMKTAVTEIYLQSEK